VTSVTGLVWVVFWLTFYRTRPTTERSAGWLAALRHRQTWGFALGKFLTDPVWWFYLYWLSLYLHDVRGFDMNQIAWALPVIYLIADFGSVAGGWLSGYLMRKGWETGRARQAAMALCASAMPVAAMAVFAPGAVLTIALISLATAAHQGWSANLYTTTSDVFPKEAVASVTGIGGCAGGLGGFLFSAVIPGFIVTHFGYTPIFLFMGALHLTALLLIRGLLFSRLPFGPPLATGPRS
jgi:ACS family hexuronate transporter-like MFS transporter